MDHEFSKEPNTVSNGAEHQKKSIWMPLTALVLSLMPFLLPFFQLLFSFLANALNFLYIFCLLAPIVGLILGITALFSIGRKRIGIIGVILSIAAIALPVIMILIIIMFFIGASTGVISLM